MEQQKSTSASPKKGGKKWLFIGLGVLGTGALSYFGWQFYKKKQTPAGETGSEELPDTTENSTEDYTAPPPPRSENPVSDFPLKKGSKGDSVKAFQEALIKKYGKQLLPKYGADGDFGTEMVNALKKIGLPETISETTFNVLVKGSVADPAVTAGRIYTAIKKMDFNTILSILKTFRNTADYTAANNAFKSGGYLVQGVRQTIVNALLNTFPDERLKDILRITFSNIGLKYDGNKWTLEGIENSVLLITTAPVNVWRTPKISVPVAANTILGKEVAKRGAYTMFEHDDQLFLVESKQVKYHNQK